MSSGVVLNAEVHLVYVTVASREEGLRIARAVVGEALAACANLLPGMISVYKWKGEVHEDPEQLLLLKTSAEKLQQLRVRVVQLHSYECPCVVSWPLEQGHPEFLQWVKTQTASEHE